MNALRRIFSWFLSLNFTNKAYYWQSSHDLVEDWYNDVRLIEWKLPLSSTSYLSLVSQSQRIVRELRSRVAFAELYYSNASLYSAIMGLLLGLFLALFF